MGLISKLNKKEIYDMNPINDNIKLSKNRHFSMKSLIYHRESFLFIFTSFWGNLLFDIDYNQNCWVKSTI